MGKIEDSLAISEIANNAYEQYVNIIGKKPAPMIANFHLHLTNDIVFVAEGKAPKNIIGFAIVIHKADGYWLENIAVEPELSGKGIGSSLILFVEKYLSKLTHSYQLYTNLKMKKNIVWYKNLNFQETDRRTEDGFERVYFTKKLNYK